MTPDVGEAIDVVARDLLAQTMQREMDIGAPFREDVPDVSVIHFYAVDDRLREIVRTLRPDAGSSRAAYRLLADRAGQDES